MKRIAEYLRKNDASDEEFPYKAEMDAYDQKYFEEHSDQDGSFPIDPEAAFSSKPLPTEDLADTVPMPSGREDMEAVEAASSLEEALRAYDNRYSVEAANNGEQSPQFGVDMLLRIRDKFQDQMTDLEDHALAMEIIAMGHAIGRMANMPERTTKDRTSLRGLLEMSKVITIAQKHAPEEIPGLEKDVRDIAEKIESRVQKPTADINPLSGPIMMALEEFERTGQQKDFDDIHEEIEHAKLNESNLPFEPPIEEVKKSKSKVSEKLMPSNTDQEFNNIMERLSKVQSPIDQERTGTSLHVIDQTDDASVAMSPTDLFGDDEDEDSKQLVSMK